MLYMDYSGMCCLFFSVISLELVGALPEYPLKCFEFCLYRYWKGVSFSLVLSGDGDFLHMSSLLLVVVAVLVLSSALISSLWDWDRHPIHRCPVGLGLQASVWLNWSHRGKKSSWLDDSDKSFFSIFSDATLKRVLECLTLVSWVWKSTISVAPWWAWLLERDLHFFL